MQAASAKMYQQAGPQGAGFNGQGAGFNGGQQGAQQEPKSDDNIQDADFEEVK